MGWRFLNLLVCSSCIHIFASTGENHCAAYRSRYLCVCVCACVRVCVCACVRVCFAVRGRHQVGWLVYMSNLNFGLIVSLMVGPVSLRALCACSRYYPDKTVDRSVSVSVFVCARRWRARGAPTRA